MREEKAAKTTPADNTLQRMVDREAKRAEGKGCLLYTSSAVFNLFLTPGDVFIQIWKLTITYQGLKMAIFMVVRLISVSYTHLFFHVISMNLVYKIDFYKVI